MPTYEYECLNCKKIFETFQKITEEPLKKCPDCYGPVKRLIGTGSGVIFKGSGFYATDYRKSKNSEKKNETCTLSDSAACSSCQHNKQKS